MISGFRALRQARKVPADLRTDSLATVPPTPHKLEDLNGTILTKVNTFPFVFPRKTKTKLGRYSKNDNSHAISFPVDGLHPYPDISLPPTSS
ncbi:hypothetical protein PoB_002294300 [Plakobranchus ocellatus]|uniref:Uncharacterized protein n=1 Tax=Plakobranchus ocellatus TaxID=259542 RepID=A0AAV3ZNP6_9GAST|nr:hypothetical protein PoB_002294300 [Plakobranchus ocellatus]